MRRGGARQPRRGVGGSVEGARAARAQERMVRAAEASAAVAKVGAPCATFCADCCLPIRRHRRGVTSRDAAAVATATAPLLPPRAPPSLVALAPRAASVSPDIVAIGAVSPLFRGSGFLVSRRFL